MIQHVKVQSGRCTNFKVDFSNTKKLKSRNIGYPKESATCGKLIMYIFFLRPSGTRAILFGSCLLMPCFLDGYFFDQQFLYSDKSSAIYIALVAILFVLQ